MPLFTIKSVAGEKTIFQVRAALALMFAVAITAGFFMDKITQESFMALATMAIAWYYSKRDTEDKKKPDVPV